MKKINDFFINVFLFASLALCGNADQVSENDCYLSIRQMQDNIHALRMNIKNYGVSKATYATLDRFYIDIENLCELQGCCNHSLQWKLSNVRKMADKQFKKSKKHIKNHVYGGGAPILAPALAVGSPFAIIGSEG